MSQQSIKPTKPKLKRSRFKYYNDLESFINFCALQESVEPKNNVEPKICYMCTIIGKTTDAVVTSAAIKCLKCNNNVCENHNLGPDGCQFCIETMEGPCFNCHTTKTLHKCKTCNRFICLDCICDACFDRQINVL